MQHAFGRHIKNFHSNMPDFLEDTSIIYHHMPDYLEDTSNIFTPTSHNSFSSSIRACKYISISFPGKVGLGINNDSESSKCVKNTRARLAPQFKLRLGCFYTNLILSAE